MCGVGAINVQLHLQHLRGRAIPDVKDTKGGEGGGGRVGVGLAGMGSGLVCARVKRRLA